MCESTPRCLPEDIMLNERYKIGRVIGEGSFGITYIGKDLLLNITVAIKEYFPLSYGSRDVRGRDDYSIYIYHGKNSELYNKGLSNFYSEATILSQFHSLDGIVSVRDFFYLNNTAYIVMDYVDGITLKEYVRKNGAIKGPEAFLMMKPIIRSLKKIHDAKILHRDISPDNILIRIKEKQLVLIDFGSAREKNVMTDKSLTVTFKRGYTSEEQYLRKGRQRSWSDVYSLCATMYFMLTGKEPNESIERMLKDRLVPLSEIENIDLTKRQKQAIMHGMSIKAEDRIQSMDELYSELYNKKRFSFNIRINNRTKTIGKMAVLFIAVAMAGIVVGFAVNNRRMFTKNKGAVAQVSATPVITQQTAETKEPDSRYYMPSFEGMTKQQALELLDEKGDTAVLVKWSKKYSNTQKGKIISQSVTDGTICERGKKKTLVLTVSNGEKKYEVPDCVGKGYKNAIQKIKEKKLSYKIIYKESKKDKGIVIGQAPKHGKMVKSKTVIKITVSKGEKIKMTPQTQNTPKPYETKTSAPAKTSVPKTQTKKNEKKNKDVDFAGSIP